MSVGNSSTIEVAGFEIRINDELVDFVADTSFVGDGVLINQCRTYSVVAIANDGATLDFGSVAFGSGTSCRSTR